MAGGGGSEPTALVAGTLGPIGVGSRDGTIGVEATMLIRGSRVSRCRTGGPVLLAVLALVACSSDDAAPVATDPTAYEMGSASLAR